MNIACVIWCEWLCFGDGLLMVTSIYGCVTNRVSRYVYILFRTLYSGKVPISSPHIIRPNSDIERTTHKGDRGGTFPLKILNPIYKGIPPIKHAAFRVFENNTYIVDTIFYCNNK